MKIEQIKSRPARTYGTTEKFNTGCGHLYITINVVDGEVFEIFATLGKSGHCGNAQLSALCRSVSAGLRAGVSPEVYVKQFNEISCPSPCWYEGDHILSCADAIGKAIKKVLDTNGTEVL